MNYAHRYSASKLRGCDFKQFSLGSLGQPWSTSTGHERMRLEIAKICNELARRAAVTIDTLIAQL